MPFVDMQNELTVDLALPRALAKTMVNRALGLIYDEQMWSFQAGESGWLTPGLVLSGNVSGVSLSAGLITLVPYTNQVTGNAIASAAWASLSGRPLLTQLQIRSPSYALYNIVSVSFAVPTAAVLTLDRAWMEPVPAGGAGMGYMLYQAYFPAPVADFKRFTAIRDTTNASPINFWRLGKKDLAVMDPQRTRFGQPSDAVPYQIDSRPGSATFGQMLYELWPHPLSVLPYAFNYLRRGPTLVNLTDTVPMPLTEELVMWRAKEQGYVWKESQKGEGVERGSGANWQFLAGDANAQYKLLLKAVKDTDRDLMPELYFNRVDPVSAGYGQMNVGRV